MAYRFKRRELVPEAARRIGDEQFAALVGHLQGETETGIHEARKCCKMLRALLRLVGPREAVAFDRADASLEKIARALAPVRDAEVRQRTFDAILTQAGPRAGSRFAQVRAVIETQAKNARHLTLTAGDLRDIVAMATVAQGKVNLLPMAHPGWRAIGPGLRKAYRHGRKALAAAADDPSLELRHRWRRHVKHLGFHVRLLHGAQPKKLGALALQLETLSETLGDEHDLGLLRRYLAVQGKRSRARAEFDSLASLIDRRRAGLRRSADKLGRRLFKAKPGEFVGRIEQAWRKWRR